MNRLVQEVSLNRKKTVEKQPTASTAAMDALVWQSNVTLMSQTGLWVNALAEASVLVNECGEILGINQRAAHYLGTSPETVMGFCWIDFIQQQHQARYQSLLQACLKNALSVQSKLAEVRLICVNGDFRDVELTISQLPTAPALWLIILRDLNFYKLECLKLQTLSVTDALTALPNRRAFDEQLQFQWQEGVRNRTAFSAILIDIDFFKHFNDQFGHELGDECLRRVAAALSLSLPLGSGMVARCGGEEFAMLLPGYDKEMAHQVALKAKQLVKQLRFVDLGLDAEVGVSISLGIATEYNGRYSTVKTLMSSADSALYRAKAQGRDCIGECC